ncbi:heme exporter protein CcmB [Rhizobium rhizosphaerae]|uniref:Heme exporter protein B n=1 Tax=Xaviernesmea rhizosphaerae TaxID=1672749 RepID=A0A1Q9ALC6_9HYPH|nr:heme exporter protein CcmB [Xaviernesmea rhizosphaerae]OLP56090.1 heme exporter protein CcmB [Xaviernesmea rhizosphaerae]
MRRLFLRDLALAFRAGGGGLTGLLFFLAVVAIVPFGIGPDLKLLARIGPSILWIGALLAALLGLDRLFQAEREDGTLDLLLMQETPLVLIVLVKCLAHWAASGLTLALSVPFLGLLLNLDAPAIGATMLTLACGTPALTLIGAGAAAVTVALPRGGLLVSVLVLPLAIPVLIFGVSATQGALEAPASFLPPFLILLALNLLFAVLGPLAAAAALRSLED